MESPIVVDKPPEYVNARNTERGFPFEESEGADGAWSELAARHPDIAARLRARPQQWQRKRRPSAHDQEDLSDDFGGFDRFPFDDIPPEFREHFPSHFARRAPPAQPTHPPAPQPPPAHPAPQHTAATQTEQPDAPGPATLDPQGIPQYGLRNTVDLGQKSPVDPSVVDAEDRTQRSMSAPPETRQSMSGASPPQAEQPPPPPQPEHAANVRHIPIFVEGRDEPVINKTDHAEPKPHPHPHPQQHAPPPPQPQPHFDREQYFNDDGPAGFHHPTNFSRAFGTPFNKNFRQGPQPFTQQKAFPQSAFRGDSPQRSQSPRREVPVHHEPPKEARPQPPPQHQQQQQYQQEQQQKFQQEQQQKAQQEQQQKFQQQQQQRQPTPPPKPQTLPNDPITLILGVQTDVLNLMTEVENFTGSKQDKRYMFLDEMLTRNLIKLDNVETEGKENIRLARKEAIRCIQKCIAVLEAKAEKGSAEAAAAAAAAPVAAAAPAAAGNNGDVAMETKEMPEEAAPALAQEEQPQAADTRPEQTEAKPEEKTPKKKVAKSKSKDTSNKVDKDKKEVEAMQVDTNSQMEVEGASASQ